MLGQRSLSVITMFVAICAAHAQVGPKLVAFPYKASGTYELGEKVGWSFTLGPGQDPTGYSYKIKRNNADVIKAEPLDFRSGKASIEIEGTEPEMLYVEVDHAGDRQMTFGAAVAPRKITPVAPKPRDFGEFWKRKIAELEAVPANPVLTEGDSGKPDVKYATIRMDHVHGTHVYGQIAWPTKPGKHPAMLILQWASPPYPLQKSWVVDRAAEGWIALNIEPHDVLPTEPASYYSALPAELKNYQAIGQQDREKSYFVEMYQRDYRGADYLTGRDDWDGKTLLVTGGSMGGQQSLCVAGLHPKITHVIVEEPAGCDLDAGNFHRQEGYPFFNPGDRPTMEAARYVDAVNFASRIHATSLVAMGYTDNVAPPTGIWAAFNLIKGKKEAAPMPEAPHNNTATQTQQMPYYKRDYAWRTALLNGETVPPPLPKDSADQPLARTDPNSIKAHEQLLEKARKGGIDLYFEGDSITRRWGTSDEAYRPFFENWKQSFFGWNAADFGWGGDTTQNILWRLENGELDGVHPKAIVVLAGTNNLGATPAGAAKIEDVTNGVEAIVETCHRKAPRAKIVLTGLLPRNDQSFAVAEINHRLASFCVGHSVKFLDLSRRLTGPDGLVIPSMTVDGLHPSLAGYQVWAAGLKPILTEILGPPATTDHAPPATGDPSAQRF